MANPSILAAFERMWQHVVLLVSGKADVEHHHDDMYYTETEVDTKVSDLQTAIDGKVPATRTINGQPLTDDIVLDIESSDKNVWYGTCGTAASTAAKVVTTNTGDFVLEAGSVIYVKFTYQSSASSMTMNVDNTGAVSVYLNGTTTIPAYYFKANMTVGFVYDGSGFRICLPATATTTYYGMVKLSSSTSSTSTTLAATPSAVKAAYDLANTANEAIENLPLDDLAYIYDESNENVEDPTASRLPVVTEEDNGKVLRVVLGDWVADEIGDSMSTSGGTMEGALVAQSNSDYTTRQVRNVIYLPEGASVPETQDGDLVLFYEE